MKELIKIRPTGFDLSYDRLLTDAVNMCRWNPGEAMLWFQNARARAAEEYRVRLYNKAVKQACATLDSIESSKYFTKYYSDSFWGENVTPTRPVPLEETHTMDEYIARQLRS